MISGLLHLPAPWVGQHPMIMLWIGLIYIGLGFLLYRGTRFVSWLVFLLSAFGIAAAMLGVFGTGGWLNWLIILANLATATSTFWLIWKKP